MHFTFNLVGSGLDLFRAGVVLENLNDADQFSIGLAWSMP